MAAVLTVEALSAAFGDVVVVDGVSFELGAGEILGLVGESGSGKTTVALSLLGYQPRNARFKGSVRLGAYDMLSVAPRVLQAIRGKLISYVPQNPTTALNPSRRIGSLLAEMLAVHGGATSASEWRADSIASLHSFGFTQPETVLSRYAHQLSGGQQQRIALALATICNPPIVVLDEPTTGLDVSTQKIVLELLIKLKRERQTSMIYVSHDLNVVAEIVTAVAVMYAGRLVELGRIADVFGMPLHPYTRALVDSRPTLSIQSSERRGLRGLLRRKELPPGCPFAPRCDLAISCCFTDPPPLEIVGMGRQVACHLWRAIADRPLPAVMIRPSAQYREPILSIENVTASYNTSSTLSLFRSAPYRAVRGVSIKLLKGEVLAIVGESGSGKSTLAKTIAGLIPSEAGKFELAGEILAPAVADRTPAQRRKIQLIFQNPDASLNPRRRVRAILADAINSFENCSRPDTDARIRLGLAEVRLPEDYADRYPDQLSGGERQRVAIARALVVGPDILICDEILSALDVSVQAGILELLNELCRRRHLTILFISHDLAVVRGIANRIGVLYGGQLVAVTTAAGLLQQPVHPYLHTLLAALPGETVAQPAIREPVADRSVKLDGCPFVTRCPVHIEGLCAAVMPPWRGGNHRLRCHQTDALLAATLPINERATRDHTSPRNAEQISNGMPTT